MRDVDTSQLSGRLLRVFLTVYDEMSVSKAAERLDTSQSTVSHNLEKLRSIMGDKLFVQAGRGIVPSDRAELLVPKVRRLLAQMDALVDNGNYVPANDPDPFVIATNGGVLVPEVNRTCTRIWREAHRKRMIFRELGPSANAENLLERGIADFAIAPRPEVYPATLCHAHLFSESLRVFYDPEVRGPIKDVCDYSAASHATLDFGGPYKSTVQNALEALNLSRDVVVSVPNVWLLAEVIRGTDTVATLPAMLVNSAFRGFGSSPLPLTVPDAEFDLVWHRRFDGSSRLKWLRGILTETLKQPAT